MSSSILDELLDYFNNTPNDIIQKEWESIHKDYAYGMDLDTYISSLKDVLNRTESPTEPIFEHSVKDNYYTNSEMSMAA